MASRCAKRSGQIEIMDDLNCQGAVVDQTLRELDFINRWLGGNAITLAPVKKLIGALTKQDKQAKLIIADLGCGSGELLKRIALASWARNLKLDLVGIDANPNITAFAQNHTAGISVIRFEALNVFEEKFSEQKFDLVLATLFMHHFTHEQLVKLLMALKKNTRQAIIINDLHRHPLAYYSIAWLTRLFSRSAMVKYDAPLSVARGFKKQEWVAILKDAGIERYRIAWCWAFRWQVVIKTN